MNPISQLGFTTRNRYLHVLNRLKTLFNQMDHAYATVADQYGFECNGCVDNCCRTRFYHHTLCEYVYLLEGLATLPEDLRQTSLDKARTINNAFAAADHRGDAIRIMCPLNQDERCLVYPFRPMICRLHGIPHELHGPGGAMPKQPGCDNFFDQCRKSGVSDYITFDRTPFYRQMAMLERQLRSQTGVTDKIKLTIAQMVVTIADGAHEID